MRLRKKALFDCKHYLLDFKRVYFSKDSLECYKLDSTQVKDLIKNNQYLELQENCSENDKREIVSKLYSLVDFSLYVEEE